ncbi:MAG TPA: sialidase family protein [Anaerolineales bacterium]
MRRRFLIFLTGIIALAVMSGGAALPAIAANSFDASNAGIQNILVSQPALNRAGTAGRFGTEACIAGGSYETNRSESNLAVDPTNPSHILGSSKFVFSSTDPFHFSLTGGQNVDWSGEYQFHLGYYDILKNKPNGNDLIPGYTCLDATPVNGKTTNYDATTDPTIAFDRQGNAYAFVLAYRYTDGTNGVYVSKRDPGGTWGAPVQVQGFSSSGAGLGHEFDKQWIAVDNSGGPRDGNIYVIYVDFSTQNGRINFARSTDHGATFSKIVTLSTSQGNGGAHGQLPQIGVDSRGFVYAVWNGNFQGNFQGQGSLLVDVSEDGGDTWQGPFDAIDFSAEGAGTPGTFDGRIIQNTTFREGIPYYFAVDAHGTHAYAVEEHWSNPDTTQPGHLDVLINRGTYDPATKTMTWEKLGKINDNSTANDSFQPVVAADNGTVVAAWYDRRLPCGTDASYFTQPGATNFCINTGVQFYKESAGGLQKSGTNLRASATTWDPQQPGDWLNKGVGDVPHSVYGSCFSSGVQGQICVTFIGDYFGVALANGNAYILNVSTAPQFNATRTLPPADRSWWSATAAFWEGQDEAKGGVTNFYQQQVLQIVPAPK